MTRTTILALVTVLLPNVAFSATSFVAHTTELQEGISQKQGAALAPRPAIVPLRGVVESVDQGSDTINIRSSLGQIEQLRVQDALIFNAVRYGDKVEVSVQTIAGVKTIVSLNKE